LNFNRISKNIRNEISLYRKEFQQVMSFLTITNYLSTLKNKSERPSRIATRAFCLFI